MVEPGRIHPLLMNAVVLAYLVCTATRIFSLFSSLFASVPELAVISFIVLPTPYNYSDLLTMYSDTACLQN